MTHGSSTAAEAEAPAARHPNRERAGEYLARYGLTAERLAKAAPNALVMHPGPMNRGVEIADEVADDPQRSLIQLQVEAGVAVRMACLEFVGAN